MYRDAFKKYSYYCTYYCTNRRLYFMLIYGIIYIVDDFSISQYTILTKNKIKEDNYYGKDYTRLFRGHLGA